MLHFVRSRSAFTAFCQQLTSHLFLVKFALKATASHLDSASPAAVPGLAFTSTNPTRTGRCHCCLCPLWHPGMGTRSCHPPSVSLTFPQISSPLSWQRSEAIAAGPHHPEQGLILSYFALRAKETLKFVCIRAAAGRWYAPEWVGCSTRAAYKYTLAVYSVSKRFDLLRK